MEPEVEGERKEKSLKIQTTNTTKAKTAKAKVAKFGRKGDEEVIDGAAVSNFCF